MPRVYLDHAATAPLRPEARAAMLDAMDRFGNASSIHQEGQAARFVLDEARRQVAELVGVRAERVVFTSGGSESNNLALRGVMAAHPGKSLLVSAVEHDCVRRTAAALAQTGVPVVTLPMDGQGIIDLGVLDAELAKGQAALVSVMHANNENGVVQPVEEIGGLCRRHGVIFHSDAVQTVGHLDVRPEVLGMDLMTFSGHKLGAPKGVGVLVVNPEVPMQSLISGGGQERNRRAGTENIPAIAGLGAVADTLANQAGQTDPAVALQAVLMRELEALPVDMVAAKAARVSHIIQLLATGRRGEDVVIGMDLHGVAVSQGSACGSGRVEPSYVLQAMGYDEGVASSGVRVSFGWNTTDTEVRAGVAALAKVLAG